LEMVSSAMDAPVEYDMTHIIQNGRVNLQYSTLSCPDLIRSSPAMTDGDFVCIESQQARSACAPSLTISGCRASETAGDIRITSACTPKIATAR
jgi:hypothetical protein